jgi:hypothetical protein
MTGGRFRAEAKRVAPRLAALVCAAVALSACSPSATIVLVRKADGFYVADGACPGRSVSIVIVTPMDESGLNPAGAAWTVTTLASPPTDFPAEGVRIGGDGQPWGEAQPQDFKVEPGVPILIATRWGNEDSGQAETFETRIEVGEYVEHSGAVGQWSDLVKQSDCLTE